MAHHVQVDQWLQSSLGRGKTLSTGEDAGTRSCCFIAMLPEVFLTSLTVRPDRNPVVPSAPSAIALIVASPLRSVSSEHRKVELLLIDDDLLARWWC